MAPKIPGREKFEATHEVGGGSESEKDEMEEDSNAESWEDTRVKGWLRPRVKTRRMNESAPESFWRQGKSGPRSVLFPEVATSDPPPHSTITCRSCRFSAKMSSSSNTDAQRLPRRGSPSPKPSPTPSSSSSGEPLGLDEGEEFILIKLSKKKGKCWATFLNDDPDHSCDGHGHFALSTSIEEILERRKRHHAKLDETAGKKEAGTLSPDREYGFSNLNVREQGEKPSPGLRQASKSISPNNESSSSEPWNPDWEGRAKNAWRAETESWGTPIITPPSNDKKQKKLTRVGGKQGKDMIGQIATQ